MNRSWQIVVHNIFTYMLHNLIYYFKQSGKPKTVYSRFSHFLYLIDLLVIGHS